MSKILKNINVNQRAGHLRATGKLQKGIMNFIQHFLNNLNWAKRDREISMVEKNYRKVVNLPMTTNNKISVEAFEAACESHNALRDKMINKYGEGWKSYLMTFSL